MNLQICVPYETCPFNCPMCIARSRKVFDNLYAKDYRQYIDNLHCAVIYGNSNYFILTGNTDPTLNKAWLEDVCEVLTNRKVELQTRNYNLNNYNLSSVETVAYSILTVKDYLRAWKFRKTCPNNRLVILLTKEFEFLNSDNFDPMGYNQITFKKLQPSSDPETNRWIAQNQMTNYDNIYKLINDFNGTNISVRLDANCQDSHGRYEIFREDGNVYKRWEDE